jgi:preprotein translocase subunit SecY
MQAWQVATILLLMALFQIAIAILYMRKRAITSPKPNVYQKWKIIFVLNLILLTVSLVLLWLPEQYWWR